MDTDNIKEFEIIIFRRTCPKCSHKWFPRTPAKTQKCPRCQAWLDKVDIGRVMSELKEVPPDKFFG